MAMTGINLYSIDYYKKTVFKGSYRGLCFRIGRVEKPPGESGSAPGEGESGGDSSGVVDGGEEAVDVLRVQAWKGPYVLEKTDEEIFTEYFEYSDDGLGKANEWLEDKQREVAMDM